MLIGYYKYSVQEAGSLHNPDRGRAYREIDFQRACPSTECFIGNIDKKTSNKNYGLICHLWIHYCYQCLIIYNTMFAGIKAIS